MPNAPIVDVISVTKRYGAVIAVDNLSLSVPQGICFGLLGPNGAGKTTLIEIMEDIIPPTAGEIRFRGKIRSANFREQIGIMFQQTALLGFLTVQETLQTFQDLYHRTYDIEELIRLCHLDDIRKQLNDKISGGQRQRLLLALAMVNQPELLFLDEPSTGLDPQARRNLWDIVQRVKREGKSIVLTTHYMEEAQQLCDMVAIMDHGRIIAKGSPEALISQQTEGGTILLPADAHRQVAGELPFETTLIEGRLAIRVKDMNAALAMLLAKGVDLQQVDVQPPTLETVFLNLTGRQLRD